MRVARLHQQSSHRQQHSCSLRATSPYLLTFPLTSLPSLSPYAERRGRRDRNLFSLHLIVAPSWLACCAAARSAAVPRHSTSGSAALPSLLQVRARWRPSFHFAVQLCSCSCATTDNCVVVARAKQKSTQLWNRRTTLEKPGTPTLGPNLHSRLPACTLWPIRIHTQCRKETILRGAPCVSSTTRLPSQLLRDLQPTHHGARAQTEPR